jgi:hypothetical protein
LHDDPAVAESLIDQAIRRVTLMLVTVGDVEFLRRTLPVQFLNGEAAIPPEALPELFDSAELRVPADSASALASPVVQWVRNTVEFSGWQESGYWYCLPRDGKLMLRDSTGVLQDAGELLLDCYTDLSDSTLANFPAAEEVRLVTMLANILRDFSKING